MVNLKILLSGFLLTSSIMTVLMIFFAFHRRTSISRAFGVTCLSIVFYSFGYAMELYSENLSEMLFWNQIQYLGLPFIAVFWVILALKYTNKASVLRNKLFWVGVFLIPCLTFIFRYTNDYHHLFYATVSYDPGKLIPVLFLEKGPWYVVNFLYLGACFIWANSLFFLQYRESTGIIRKQCLILFIGSILPWISTFLDLLNLSPYGIDFGAFTTTLACALYLIAFFKVELFNLKPLAKDRIFECTADGILIMDANYRLIEFNTSASQIFPFLTSKSLGKTLEEIPGNHHKLIQAIYHEESIPYEVLREGFKSYYSVNTSNILIEDNEVLGRIVTITDVSKYVEMMEKLNQLATKDDLTGIYNRRYFFEKSSLELEHAKRNQCPLSIIILDTDHFKSINDQHGHHAGDIVLEKIANICLENIRSVDTLARLGGEEFVILLPDTTLKDSVLIADRIRRDIESAEINYENNSIQLSASFGVTGVHEVNSQQIKDFLRKADEALYQAKEDGRNCIRTA
ncbi:MAG: putative diguanylate cyclase YcdT [Candidatus Dichloromethanomonas elyunquensis]|nr:MAG: putative diguanylate cyclase YcdT [Candidatus Dichloromethanomonas elyunquensis]